MSNDETWGERSRINRQDIKRILIENSDGVEASLTTQVELSAFIDALNKGVFDPAVFDIRAPDFIVTLDFKNGNGKIINLWLVSGANLFTDSDDDGHYTLPEDARVKLVEIMKDVQLWIGEE
jgi:hypothetical protein